MFTCPHTFLCWQAHTLSFCVDRHRHHPFVFTCPHTVLLCWQAHTLSFCVDRQTLCPFAPHPIVLCWQTHTFDPHTIFLCWLIHTPYYFVNTPIHLPFVLTGKWAVFFFADMPTCHPLRGAGIAQWLERRTHDWKVAGSNPCWNSGRIFFSRVDFLCWLLFRYPFHPCVTTVARKNPGHSAKSAGGRLQLNTHTSHVCGFYWTVLRHWSQLVPNMSNDIWGH